MDFVESHMRDEIKKFRRLLKGQERGLTFDGVHDLRVCTRRLRAQISLIERSSPHHLLTRSRRTLKKLGKALGERRQWDVALAEAPKFGLSELQLRRDRRTAGIKLLRLLRGSEVQSLPQILAEFDLVLKNENIQIPPKEFKKMRSQLKAWLKRKKFSSRDLHELRISTKKIRYVFECMDLPAEELKDLQDRLGKSHDLTVLSQYFHHPKRVRKADRKERHKVCQLVRPALRSSLEVLRLLR